MTTKSLSPRLLFFFYLFCILCYRGCYVHGQEPSTQGYPCRANQTVSPCHTYVFYRATSPNFLDLASIADLFGVSRLMISNPSNISSPAAPLDVGEPLFVPITCSCNAVNASLSLSYANINYTIMSGNTFYLVSTNMFLNLTTYQSVEVVNPTFIPTKLEVGDKIIFPLFCKCPTAAQKLNQTNFLITYVYQPSDNLSSVASRFGSTVQSIVDVNGNRTQNFETIFIPVSKLPNITQPNNTVSAPNDNDDNEGAVIGLGIGLGICAVVLILVGGFWFYRESLFKKKEKEREELMKVQQQLGGEGKGKVKEVNPNLLTDVSDCLDKYKLYDIEQLRNATDGFDQKCLIQGSVYKGYIDGEVFAIKKMKWNAFEELKILQKINHGNLVRLEGFCIDPDDANCYLVYEYVENGSLHSWLHGNKSEKLNWKTRLRIAVDVANGLQYIHEHTRPRVVHKDIKSSNVLLDANLRAKIANFGLAKSGCNAITMHIVGTQGYIAPEYLADGIVSTKMDVFSFGVVLLELVAGREAIDEDGKLLSASAAGIMEGSDEKRKERRLKGWIDPRLLEDSFSWESVMSVMSVAMACLNRDPSKRPSMVDIVYALCKSEDFFFDISDEGLSPRQVPAR
ncbi:serine/threonine receptor-like kinase NFP [Diospyros lotus]|uniref:serine/threonine receptor-like kinase NFP n=1 Tax=Diospyros lotus TaxID=55363 RepID=UPI002253FAD4|nr:serine/threonine receptor-like kinase NFP [Diospyros lotus]